LQTIQCRRFAVILFLFSDKFSGYPMKLFLRKKRENKTKVGIFGGFFFREKD
jgi:hypothetical protein